MTRSKQQREQDRADLLAVLEDATEPIATEPLIAMSLGMAPHEYPGHTACQRGRNDLHAMRRAGLVVSDREPWRHYVKWALANDDTLTEREQTEDEADVRRQMATWEPADEQETAS